MTNTLYYGDNLHVRREHVGNESVDLVYLDPPFNSKANYNILFKSPEGQDSDAQIEAFEDTWHWTDEAESAFDDVMKSGNTKAFDLLNAMRSFLGENDMMAYLAMMAVRLIELHRVLKPTGSLYLHCDPTASHYLKLLLDGVFGAPNFKNEFVWKRSSAHNDGKQGSKRAGRIHDIIFFYTKTNEWVWNTVYQEYDEDYLLSEYKRATDDGRAYKETDLTAAKPGGDVSYEWRVKRPTGENWTADLDEEYLKPKSGWEYKAVLPYENRYWAYSKANMLSFHNNGQLIYRSTGMPRLAQFADEMPGVSLQDLWSDIPPLGPKAQERLGYPTQKPLALLERIVAASSNEGDIVLDPFCGCGTAVHAAEKLGRQWLGIDITHLAVSLIEKRMQEAFPDRDFAVVGRPQSLAAAQDLAKRNKNEFEKWAVTAIDGIPYRTGKGADGGVDGLIYFNGHDGDKIIAEKAIISVKGGETRGVGMVSELVETIGRQKAAVGILVMAALPTREMEKRAAAAGIYDLGEHGRFPRIQILTLAEMFRGKVPRLPNIDRTGHKAAKREEKEHPKLI